MSNTKCNLLVAVELYKPLNHISLGKKYDQCQNDITLSSDHLLRFRKNHIKEL